MSFIYRPLRLMFAAILFILIELEKEDAYSQVLAGRLSHQERSELVRTLCKRGKHNRPEHIARGKSRTNTESL